MEVGFGDIFADRRIYVRSLILISATGRILLLSGGAVVGSVASRFCGTG